MKKLEIRNTSIAQAIIEEMEESGDSFVETMRRFLFDCRVNRVDIDPVEMAGIVKEVAEIWTRKKMTTGGV